LTRVKVAPGAEGFFDGSSGEAKRGAEMAAKLSAPSLTRAWSMLLKGLFEVRDAARPVQACEMALIRLAYAADLPPTDKLVRDLMDAQPAASSGAPSRAPAPAGTPPRAQSVRSGETMSAAAPQPQMAADNALALRTLEDIAAMAQAKGAPVLKVHVENDVHLV